MLVVVGHQEDRVTRVLVGQLSRLFPCHWIKPEDIGGRILVDDKGIAFDGQWFAFSDIKVFINRLLEIPGKLLAKNISWQKLLSAMEWHANCVLNRPSVVMGNFFKPQQLRLIERFFSVPRSKILFNESIHPELPIIKSISSVRSVVASQKDLQASWAFEPVLSQQYVKGYHVRLHVIGDVFKACRIDAALVDYRYCQEAIFSICHCPQWVQNQASKMMQVLGAIFAGIDFIVCDDDRWVCLEVNLAPGFTYFDEKLGKAAVLEGLVEWIEARY